MRLPPAPMLALVAMVAAGCGDATTPVSRFRPPQTINPLVARFDTLRREAAAGGDGPRAAALTAVEIALGDGATPSVVDLEADSVAERYAAVVLSIDDQPSAAATPRILFRELVAWQGTRADRLVAFTARSDSGRFGFAALADGAPPPAAQLTATRRLSGLSATVAWFAARGFVVARPAAVDGPCTRPDDPLHPELRCRRITYGAAFDARFEPVTPAPATNGAPIGAVHLVAPPTTVAGVQLLRRCDLAPGACVVVPPEALTPPAP